MDLLERELLLGLLEEAEGERAWLVPGAELDFHGFAEKLGKRLGHFSVENERSVGVQFFLELEELVLTAGPWTGFIHGKHEQVAALVVGEGVEDGGMGDPHRAGGWCGLVHDFLERRGLGFTR